MMNIHKKMYLVVYKIYASNINIMVQSKLEVITHFLLKEVVLRSIPNSACLPGKGQMMGSFTNSVVVSTDK